MKNEKIKADLQGDENSILDDFEKLRNEKKRTFKEKVQVKQKILNERLKIQADRYKGKEFE
jgi:hypothetical protein